MTLGGRRAAPAGAAVALGVALVLPASGGLAAGPALVEQKLRLLEGYFQSETAGRIRDGANADAVADLSRARGLVIEARDALAAGEGDRAATLADDALRAFSAASRLAGRSATTSGAQRTRYEELREAMASFRATLDRAHGAGVSGSVPDVDLAALDAEVARAARLAADGYLDRANALLAELYQDTMRAISRARGSETVVYRLEFQTPADELAYERERFRGNELLLDMLQEGGASESAKRLARRFVEQARATRDEALALAGRGDVPGAIETMERASSLLGRALRSLGLPYAP